MVAQVLRAGGSVDGAVRALRARLAEVSDLAAVGAVLSWDQQTMMPPGGAPSRADALATVGRLAHEHFIDSETGRLLEAVREHEAGLDPDSDEAAIIRCARRDWERARRVPAELAGELARCAALGHQAWEDAREASDFERFRPHLERMLELKRRYVDCFAGFGDHRCAYDVLLDDFEEGARTDEVARVFARLREGLVPLVEAICGRAGAVDSSCLHGSFPAARQEALIRPVLERMGYHPGGWRLDVAAHPFAVELGRGDIRITTRYDESYVGAAFYGALHECGHGLYEDGVAPGLARSPAGSGVSLGMHESQSRLWENVVGRSRPFTAWALPRFREAFPDAFAEVDAEGLYRAVNRVEPSLIRVEADEATYSLHIILRFELEQELIEGRVAVRDLPGEWNRRVADLLGLEVPDDARGVLQDVHWSGGAIGYFPTYALGSIMAAQIWEAVRAERPDLDGELAAGDFGPLREWLRERIHRHGRKYGPRETLERAVGGPLDPEPYLRYLNVKFGEIYGL